MIFFCFSALIFGKTPKLLQKKSEKGPKSREKDQKYILRIQNYNQNNNYRNANNVGLEERLLNNQN